MEKSPDEVFEFLDKLKESDLQHCNVKKVASKLERDKVIDRDQKQQIDKCQSNASANELLYKFLCDDPAPETLKGAAEVLKSAPGTTNMNKRCAKAIEAFLFGIDPARLLEFEEKRPDEVIEFLDQLKKDNLQYCNVKKVASKLERDKVIDKDQKQQIDKCQGNASANELLYKFLCDDPAPETLKGAAKVLKNAHGTTNMNKKCAKIIEDFLGIDPAQSLEEPPSDQLAGAVATKGQSTSAAVTALGRPDWRKLFEAFDEIESLESHEIKETYRKTMTKLCILLDKITPKELRAILASLQAGKWQLGISLDDIPDTKEKLEKYIFHWTTPLDVRMIEYTEEAIEDKEKKKKLVEALENHRDELKSFSEKSLECLKEQRVKLAKGTNVSHIVVEVALKPEEYLLRELLRLQKYLEKNLRINPLLFKGFISSSILLIFQILSSSAVLLAPSLLSHLSALRDDYSVTKILVQDHFAVDVSEGNLYPLLTVSEVQSKLSVAGKVEFDGDQLLLYKDQSTCTGEPPSDQSAVAVATKGQSTSAAVTALGRPDKGKLSEAFNQIASLESHEIREMHRKIMIQLSNLLNEITQKEIQCIHSSLQSGCQWQLGISLDIPDTKKELQTFIADWTTPLDVRMIEYVEEAIEDKRKKKKLVEALKKQKKELKSFSEKSLKYLKEQGVKLVNRKHFTSLKPEEYQGVELAKGKVSLNPEEYLLSELLKLKFDP